MRYSRALCYLLSFFAILALACPRAAAQSSTTGDLTGTVTDPTNAIVPNVMVQLKNLDQGGVRDTKTNDTGVYRFSLLAPGRYEVDISATGFQPVANATTVSVGQITALDVKLMVQQTTETVVVTAEAPLLQTEGGSLSSTLSSQEIQNMPNQGNDMTYPLLTTPGVTENTLGGYGNYSVNGLSSTSNLFTVNGMDDNDPYLSVNNTGATSLMLGQSEVQEATIVANGYGGQYADLAGSNVNYVTKSGTNDIHGSAKYYWNGRVLNANGFFQNGAGVPRGFDNDNQWSGDIGGPAIKNKLFWYFDTEGIRFILPSASGASLVPDPAFETATIDNLNAMGLSASVPFYENIFGLFNTAAKANGAVPGLPGGGSGCGTTTIDAAGDTIPFAPPGVTNCVDHFLSSATLFTKEAVYAWRIDYNIGVNDKVFGRVQMDRGFQGSYTDPINPAFDLVSNQPEDQGQLEETHTFGPTATNQFIMAGQWYSATFLPPSLSGALAAFPTTMVTTGLATLGGLDEITPQGRNVTQVQFSDDVTKTKSRHTFKFGVKYRANYVTDLVYGENTSGTLIVPDLDAFYNGGYDPAYPENASVYEQSFPNSPEERFKFWTLGGYAEDDIQVKPGLTITLALRGDHEANPSCKNLCFARLVEPFNELVDNPTLGGAAAASVPYNQILTTGNKTALTGLTNIEWAPRLGFAWQPLGVDHNTVVRGGVGIFWDTFPGTIVDNISENPPLYQQFTVGGASSPLLLSPAEPGNVFASAKASNSAFLSGFSSGENLGDLEASVPGFAVPSVNFTAPYTKVPQVQKWSLQIEQGLGKNTSVQVAYDGNHGIHEVVQNAALNAYSTTGFVGLPSAPPDPRFGFADGIFTEGISSYNGLTLSATHRYTTGLLSVNYTYSHALDEVSNGGFAPFAYEGFLSTNTSPIFQENPNCLRCQYGSADYDVRHYFSATYLWELPIKRLTFGHGPDTLVKGWNVSGTVLARSGLPFTVVDLSTTAALEADNYGPIFSPGSTAPEVFATATGASPGTCTGPGSNYTAPCFNTAAFTTSPTNFGNVGRNSMRGPGYFNSDFSIWKALKVIPHNEKAEFDIGLQAYNVFNHQNFDNPYYDVSNPSEFGILQRTVSPATTIYGVALGGNAAPRLIQLKASFQY